MGILKVITDAQIATAVVYPTTPYKGTLPTKTVKIGSKGTSVLAVQRFLNWCIKANLKVDGICGNKTSAAIRRFQKQQKLKVDGIFGEKTRARALAIVKKYEVEPLKPTPTSRTWVDNANAWAKKIASDNSYHYVKWSNDKRTHECPICHKHPVGKFHGWNCIGFGYAIWHHGGGLKNHCNCHIIANDVGNKMYKVSTSEALKIAKKHIGLDDIKVIKNKRGIPKSEWKAGDMCMMFSGSKYVHTFYYMGNGKVCDSTGSSGKVPNDKQIAVRSYKKYSAKIIIRYVGK